MTNFELTKQTQGVCAEDFNQVDCICQNDTDCQNIKDINFNWHGLPTGKCIETTENRTIKVCEIISWCPVEKMNTK